MKIKSLKLSNFSDYGKVEVNFDDNVTFLIGKNGSGKSTIGITAVWFILAGIAEKSKTALIGERFRFIGNGAVSASGELVLYDDTKKAEIVVTRRITKSGNELSFKAPEGYEVGKEWLESLFNVFLIAPKKFTELTSKQQAEALGVDTSSIDQEILELKQEYTLINRDLTNLGQLVVVAKTDRVIVEDLIAEKNEINEFNKAQTELKLTRERYDNAVKAMYNEALDVNNQILELEARITVLKEKGDAITKRIDAGLTTIAELKDAQELKPSEEIDTKIFNASQTNEKAVKYEQYLVNLKKQQSINDKLKANKEKQAKKQQERTDYIKGQKFPFENLTISDDGELLLSGKPIKEPYFSTGELLKIVPVLMASKNPELKYVFIQDFNLLDEDKQADIERTLTEQGMQLVIELVGTKKVEGKNCILLKDCKVVETYSETSNVLL